MKRKAIITSIKGYNLTSDEKKLFKENKPWGLILFRRNIKSIKQVKKLVIKIRSLMKDKKFPIMIDEEGPSVSRFGKLIPNKIPQKFIGDLYEINPKLSKSYYKVYLRHIINILKKVGININTIPVLDVLSKNTSSIIGNRSFSNNPKIVKILGQVCIDEYFNTKMGSVIKHIPGHGCASEDSHLKLPKVSRSYKDLKKSDFLPFKIRKAFFAMTAHILYKNLDRKNPATTSKKIIKRIIREKIGFKGMLISDDISMKALKNDLITNAKKSLLAGCNLVLYCAGNYKDNSKLLKEVPFIDKFTEKKTSEFYKFLR